MCGFVGFVGLDPTPDIERLTEATGRLRHRGPDDQGIQTGNGWGLGFRRLSILDLGKSGHQPMSNADSTTWLVFNGEIYNYKRIRNDLEKKGCRFKGSGDTETLLSLYEHLEGDIEKLLAQINGMFAFSILDLKRRKLVLARDRLGVKPLHYCLQNNGLLFSSEIKALTPLMGALPSPDMDALLLYLRFGFVPGWSSIYPGIKKLKPGHYAEFDLESGEFSIKRYWQPQTGREVSPCSEKQWLERIDDLLTDATKIRMHSDVPLGVFLSGGIDSGLVAGKVAQNSSQVAAYTIRHPDPREDESYLATRTSDSIGLPSIISDASSIDRERLLSLIAHFDEPFADSSAIVTDQISEIARRFVTVILSGDGGDESFGGYIEYPKVLRFGWLNRLPDSPLATAGSILSKLPAERAMLIGRRLSMRKRTRFAWSHLYPYNHDTEDLISSDLKRLPGFDESEIANLLQLPEDEHPLNQAQLTDLQLYLVDDVLTKVDTMSMRHSLEVRSPLLDYRLVDLALSIPPNLRVSKDRTKRMLRKLAERSLPQEIVRARKKGFTAPVKQLLWDNETLRPFAKELISDLAVTGWFDKSRLSSFLEDCTPDRYRPASVYRLFCLAIWNEAR